MVYQAISTAAVPITQPTTMPAIVIPGRVSEGLLGIVGAGVLEDELTDDHLDEIVDELEAVDVDELVASAAAESDVASKAYVVPAGVAGEIEENVSLNRSWLTPLIVSSCVPMHTLICPLKHVRSLLFELLAKS
jgi:hypothetical protein